MVVQLYVQGRPTRFIKLADKEGLICLQTSFMPHEGFTIERDKMCACHDEMVVKDRTMIIKKGTHEVTGYPCYGLPLNCTLEEELTIVTWLTRERFLSFGHAIEKGVLKRFLVPNKIFQKQSHSSCNSCEVYGMIREPIFCLKSIVVSMKNKGPTVESVLTCPLDKNWITPSVMP